MGRMPSRLPQARAARPGGGRRMPGVDVSSGVNQAAEALNQVAAHQTAKKLEARNQADALSMSTTAAGFRARQGARLIAEADALEDDGVDGFTDRFGAGVDEAIEAEIGAMPERLQERMRAELTNARENLRARAFEVEHGRRVEMQERMLDRHFQNAGASVFHDATQYETELEKARAAIDVSGLSARRRAAAHERAPGVLANHRMLGLVDSNPNLALREINAGQWNEALTPEQQARYRNAAEAEIARRRAEAERRAAAALDRARTDLRARMEDDLASIAVTGRGVGVQLNQIEAIFGADAADAYMQRRRETEETFALVSRWRFAEPEQIADDLRRQAPRAGQEGFAGRSERHGRLVRAAQGVVEARAADPVGAALAADPVLERAYADLGASTTSAAARRLTLSQIQDRQARLGVPAAQRRIVSASMADNYAAQVRGAAAAERGRVLANMADEIQAVFGPSSAQALAEIGRAAQMPDIGALAAISDPNTRRRAAQALAAPEVDLGASQTRQLGARLDSELGPLRESLAATPGGIERFAAARDAAERIARFEVANGASPQNAADTAAQAFASSYRFRDGMRIPRTWRGQPLNSSQIAQGAAALRADIGNEGRFHLPAGDPLAADRDQAATSRDAFFMSSRWVSLPNDRGLVLVNRFGEAITDADGREITAGWEDLLERQSRRPAEHNAPSGKWGVVE